MTIFLFLNNQKIAKPDGKAYLDMSDADIHARWLKETHFAGNFEQGPLMIFGLISILLLPITLRLTSRKTN